MKFFLRGLSFLSILLLLGLLWAADLWAIVDRLESSFFVALVVGTLLLTAAWLAPALAWFSLLGRNTPRTLSRRDGVLLYGTTQIQKYVPGNVFHFLVRHLKARERGESHEELFWATMGEILGQLLGATLFVGLFLVLFLGFSLAGTEALSVAVLAAFFALIILFGVRLLPSLLPFLIRNLVRAMGEGARQWYAEIDLETTGLTPGDLWKTLPWYSLYFLALGGAALLLLASAVPLSVELLFLLLAITSLSWIVGFLLPGAPGGLGPREAVLAAGLGPLVGLEEALLLAFGLRVATMTSDLLFFLISTAVERFRKKSSE